MPHTDLDDSIYTVTRWAICGGCGGRDYGHAAFHPALSQGSRDGRVKPGTPLPIWKCANCGHNHHMRGGWPVLVRKLHAAGESAHAEAAEAERVRRYPEEP